MLPSDWRELDFPLIAGFIAISASKGFIVGNDTVDQIKVDVEIQKDTKCIVNLTFSSTLYLFTA